MPSWGSYTMIAALHEACMKLWTGQAGMLSGVVVACGASLLNLSIWKRERKSAILLHTMHNAYIKVVVSCTKYNKRTKAMVCGALVEPFSRCLWWLGCHNRKKNLLLLPGGSPSMNSNYGSFHVMYMLCWVVSNELATIGHTNKHLESNDCWELDFSQTTGVGSPATIVGLVEHLLST